MHIVILKVRSSKAGFQVRVRWEGAGEELGNRAHLLGQMIGLREMVIIMIFIS